VEPSWGLVAGAQFQEGSLVRRSFPLVGTLLLHVGLCEIESLDATTKGSFTHLLQVSSFES
jgi:hypothetical protein